jgi:RNA polymerase sigma-70 factor (ECF subfamily)
VKAWLARATANTVLRGEQPRPRLARWSRWFPTTPTVDGSRFQGADEPHPRHWRRYPDPWRAIDPGDPDVHGGLAEVIDELPRPWREVLIDRDVLDRDATEIGERRGLTPAQQRAMLNRARARVRERLAQRFARRRGG